MCWIESDFFPLVWGFCNALGLIQSPTCCGKIQPARWSHDFSCDCCFAGGHPLWILSITSSFLVETASKYSWDLQSDYLVAEKMGAVGKHIISFPTILLLAVRFWCAMSPPFPLESLPQYIASKQLQGFQDSLNCSYSQDGGWDSHPADHSQPLCTGMWHPGFPNVRMLVLGWAGCTYDDGGLVTAWVNPTGTPPAVLKSCCRSAGLELCCNRIQLGHILMSWLKYL